MTADVALVTGGAGGLGRAVARVLAAAGHPVALLGRSLGSVEAAAREVAEATGGRAIGVAADVADRSAVARAVAEVGRVMGPPLVVVNGAGIAESRPLLPPDDALWHRTLAVNATGPWVVSTECLPEMRRAGRGRIVNVASTAGLKAFRYTAAYTASKHALVGLTRALAEDLAGTGVTVNAVCPGFLDTPMTDRTVQNVARKTGRGEAEARAAVAAMNPRGRLVPPEEVAREILRIVRDGSVHGRAIVLE